MGKVLKLKLDSTGYERCVEEKRFDVGQSKRIWIM